MSETTRDLDSLIQGLDSFIKDMLQKVNDSPALFLPVRKYHNPDEVVDDISLLLNHLGVRHDWYRQTAAIKISIKVTLGAIPNNPVFQSQAKKAYNLLARVGELEFLLLEDKKHIISTVDALRSIQSARAKAHFSS